ncbi:hypothetical protein EKD16_18115 [Streptomonospora litoralis]|uniref:Uncharacterized protein n=1 Tax=Streptomonospora litoralis TaxID=2498135 RepID=A0A4P6Q8R9_9ACTN|nr:hypothetical protein EKD16_18115 [Streptomonospora litoralis]
MVLTEKRRRMAGAAVVGSGARRWRRPTGRRLGCAGRPCGLPGEGWPDGERRAPRTAPGPVRGRRTRCSPVARPAGGGVGPPRAGRRIYCAVSASAGFRPRVQGVTGSARRCCDEYPPRGAAPAARRTRAPLLESAAPWSLRHRRRRDRRRVEIAGPAVARPAWRGDAPTCGGPVDPVAELRRTRRDRPAARRGQRRARDRAPPQDAFPDWSDWYNDHRPHTGIGGRTPASRVTNLPGHRTYPTVAPLAVARARQDSA